MDASSPVSIARSFVRRRNECLLCERNISYSFILVFLKLCVCFVHGVKICTWFGLYLQVFLIYLLFLTHIRLASFYGGI